LRRVIKYGGTSLATPEHFEKAAKAISSLTEQGEQIAVVVSAMGDETCELLRALDRATHGKADYKTQVEVVSIGEEKSALMMTAALATLKVPAVAFYPLKRETWPIVVDSDDTSPIALNKINEERDFTLRSQKTLNRFNKFVLPLLRVGTVPVIAGFVAINSQDELLVLGRGGSDITAFIVAKYIDADEVVIVTDVEGVMSSDPKLVENPVTDVEGVMSSDPKLVENPVLLQELSVEDAEAMAVSGSRVIHPKALKYKTPQMNVKIIDFRNQEELAVRGTTIYGESSTSIFKNDKKLSMLTIIGTNWANKPGILQKFSSILAEKGISINSSTVNARFICFFVAEEDAEEAHRALHSEAVAEADGFISLNLTGGVGEICLRSPAFIEASGVIAEFTRVLARSKINILEMLTSVTDIYIYVKWENLDQAYNSLLKLVKLHWQK